MESIGKHGKRVVSIGIIKIVTSCDSILCSIGWRAVASCQGVMCVIVVPTTDKEASVELFSLGRKFDITSTDSGLTAGAVR